MAARLVKWVIRRLKDDILPRKKDGTHTLNNDNIDEESRNKATRKQSNMLNSINVSPDIKSPENKEETALVNAKIASNSASLLENPKVYKTLIYLLLAILKILLIVLVIVSHSYSENANSVTLCTSEECLRSAANLKFSLDPSMDPCDDFYKYACGRWSQEHPNHGWYLYFSTPITIVERILFETEFFLQSNEKQDEPNPVKQARDLYKSCMDSESTDALGLGPLFKYLKKAELPQIPSFFTRSDEEEDQVKGIVEEDDSYSESDEEDSRFNFLRSDALIKKIFGMDVLIGFAIGRNYFNTSENVMYLEAPSQECPLPSVGGKRWNKDVIRFVLKTILRTVTGKEADANRVEKAVAVLADMNAEVDDLIEKYPDSDFPRAENIKLYQNQTNELLLNDTNQEYPRVIETYLEYLFENTNATVDFDRDLIYVFKSETGEDYLPKILSYALKTSPVDMELFMWWKTVYAMIINTSSDIKLFLEKQIDPRIIRAPSRPSHSLKCAELVIKFMGMAVSYGIANRTFTNTTKHRVEAMVENIKEDFVEQVQSLSWMDDASKSATLEKSKEMLSFIGYPDYLFEDGFLERYYKGVVLKSNTFLDNMMDLVQHDMLDTLQSLRQVPGKSWPRTPTEVNAFYSPLRNSIYIPLAILYFPVYHLGLEVLNYGAMGSVVGHELTHGFDDTGREFDKYGNYRQWWTSNETIKTFEEKSQCFAKQYENITIEGVQKHVKGNKTLGEVLADNGGLNEAYRAYKKLELRNGFEAKLPGFENFTHDQLFFIAYGSFWCETVNKDILAILMDSDKHPPSSVRVLGAVQNSPYFAEAFNCPLGSKMNPAKKCKLW